MKQRLKQKCLAAARGGVEKENPTEVVRVAVLNGVKDGSLGRLLSNQSGAFLDSLTLFQPAKIELMLYNARLAAKVVDLR